MDYNKEPLTVGSGTVMPELKDKLFEKYPMTEEEKLFDPSLTLMIMLVSD